MNRQKLLKHIIKQIDNRIKIHFVGGDICCCYSEDKKIIFGNNIKNSNKMDNIYFINDLKERGLYIDINIELWSLLHEVGHIQTHTDKIAKEYHECVDVINYMIEKNMFSEYDIFKMYASLEFEALATLWAYNFITNNYNFIKQIDSFLHKSVDK